MQGDITEPGGGVWMVVDNTDVAVNQNINVTGFVLIAPGAQDEREWGVAA